MISARPGKKSMDKARLLAAGPASIDNRRPLRPWVLVVEDNDIQRVILRTTLSRLGCEIDTAVNGLEAIWKVLYRNYDLVLIDYVLPEINGLTAARVIHYLMGEMARPRLIALTAKPGRLTEKEGDQGSAFDEIIGKPEDLTELLPSVNRNINAMPDTRRRQAADSALLWNDWNAYNVGSKAPATPSRGSRGGEKRQTRAARILIVEDDEVQQLTLRSSLEASGYVVDSVADGLRALPMILGGTYDLVLVDYRLPEMDGLAVARLIHILMSEDARPRMIALTAAPGHLTGRETETGSSFDEIIQKSPDLPALFASVNRQLRSSSNGASPHLAEL
jgi:two-component system, sensor histidine kinase and response regulator